MLRHITALGAVAAVLIVGTAACSGRSAGPQSVRAAEADRAAIPGLAGRRCDLASRPDALPRFSDLARIGTRGNISLWGVDMATTDSVIVSVRYDDEGHLEWTRVIRSSLTPDRAEAIERLLTATLNDSGPADWGVRLFLVGGDVTSMAPSVICPPEALRELRRRVVPMVTGPRDVRALEQARGIRYPIQIFLDANGRITNVNLPRSSGDNMVDQFLIDSALSASFRPKLHDGIRTPTMIERHIYIPRRRR